MEIKRTGQINNKFCPEWGLCGSVQTVSTPLFMIFVFRVCIWNHMVTNILAKHIYINYSIKLNKITYYICAIKNMLKAEWFEADSIILSLKADHKWLLDSVDLYRTKNEWWIYHPLAMVKIILWLLCMSKPPCKSYNFSICKRPQMYLKCLSSNKFDVTWFSISILHRGQESFYILVWGYKGLIVVLSEVKKTLKRFW